MSNCEYEYVIIGAGIAGCSVGHFLSKYSDSILLIDKNETVANGASGAAGAFLSPLLGKENPFKNLIKNALKFSTSLYKEIAKDSITQCGVCRIPKDEKDNEKFKSYIPHMDFEYEVTKEGYFFKFASQVVPFEICETLSKHCEKKLNYNVEKIEKTKDGYWLVNNQIKTKKLILTTGANIKLIDEKYFNIRAVWGQKIDIHTTTCTSINYHKECSVSHGVKVKDNKYFKVTIGATHHNFDCDKDICNYCVESLNINNNCSKCYTNNIIDTDSKKLLELAADIIKLDDVKVINTKIGARSCSVDYFPMVGDLIDSKLSIKNYPHLVNGSFVTDDKLSKIENLFVLNGVGGRGFVLSPFLANELVEFIVNNKKIDDKIRPDRLFKRWVKKEKLTYS